MSSASPRFRKGRHRTQAQTWAFTDKPNRGLAMQKNRTTYPTGRQAVANDEAISLLEVRLNAYRK